MSKLKHQFKSVQDIEAFRTKLKGLKIQLPGFQKFTLYKLGGEIILSEIHRRMKQANFSQKIIDGTILTSVYLTGKHAKLHFRSEYFSDCSFDVALAREKGTKKHSIHAPEPTPERPNPYLVFEIDGKTVYAKHVDVNGLPKLLIIKNTIAYLKEEFAEKYRNEFQNWYVSNMGGIVIAS